MEHSLSTLAMGAATCLAFALILTATLKHSARTTAVSGIVAVLSGLLIYGCGYTAIGEPPVSAILRAVFSVCRMFLGESDYGDICSLPAFRNPGMNILFWGIHLLAFYTTASAAISVMGAKLLKKMAMRLRKPKELSIIYGVNPESLELGCELEKEKGHRVVFVDKYASASEIYGAEESGLTLRLDSKATSGSDAFLRSVGAFKRGVAISIYAVSKDSVDNWEFSHNVLRALEKEQISPERTTLTILAREEMSVLNLQNNAPHYGFGFVTVFQEHSLAARLLIRNYPPCNYIPFDEDGKATEDFHVLMVGFGRLGQENLKQLIMNGQFHGSAFRAAVFSSDCEETTGFFFRQYPGILDHYDITFHPHDGRSVQLYDYVAKHLGSIKYIVVNTGSQHMNREIAEDLALVLSQVPNPPPVLQCSCQEIVLKNIGSAAHKSMGIYSCNVPALHKNDNLAMLVNQQYMGSASGGALNDWMKCDYLSRMSCRAFADFIGAYLRCLGITEEAVLEGKWNPTENQLENMSKTEHERWCAFHYCMGYTPMTEEEYGQRAQLYRQQKEQGITPLVRIGKNTAGKTHACLVSWEELDVLSQKEQKITGKAVDYQRYDTDNIQIIPQLLRKKAEN